jgi:nitroreductase
VDIFEAIFTRRSIRKYTGQQVSEPNLQAVLRAGCYAPSAHNHHSGCNRQPWEFVVVRQPESLQAIAAGHPCAKMMPEAGCCIVICGDKNRQAKTGSLVEDCSAAIQNMLLAAHGLGLGAVWCGLYPHGDCSPVPQRTRLIARLLDLPQHIIPVGLIAIGHKAEDRQVDERFDPDKIHADKW